jgi:hypothetical protein
MDRKQLINALEEHAGVKATYMGVPSFAYQILIAEKIYIIDKQGKITTEDGTEIEPERLLKGEGGEKEPPKPIQRNEAPDLEISIPMDGHTGSSLRNIVNMLYSKQVHLKKAFGLEADIIQKEFVETLNTAQIETIEQFCEILKTAGREKCGIDFDFDNKVITFKFGIGIEDFEKVDALTKLAALICKSAKELKYASFKPSADDNIKFTMRTWLIRLGFVGCEYKAARKAILKNLEGNGAFRKPKDAQGRQGVE